VRNTAKEQYMFDFVTSDQHFGHKKLLEELSDRPFDSIEAMDEEIIENYNAEVRDGDICLWLGDAFLCPREKAIEIVRRLNGKKVMILGNHDKSASWLLSVGIDVVFKGEYLNMHVGGRRARACHYPYWEEGDRHNIKQKPDYPIKRKGEVLIHGHSHLSNRLHGNQIHVGVDGWEFFPASREALEQLARKI
jgi:calcineurin-like phosphoesterase family protein